MINKYIKIIKKNMDIKEQIRIYRNKIKEIKENEKDEEIKKMKIEKILKEMIKEGETKNIIIILKEIKKELKRDKRNKEEYKKYIKYCINNIEEREYWLREDVVSYIISENIEKLNIEDIKEMREILGRYLKYEGIMMNNKYDEERDKIYNVIKKYDISKSINEKEVDKDIRMIIEISIREPYEIINLCIEGELPKVIERLNINKYKLQEESYKNLIKGKKIEREIFKKEYEKGIKTRYERLKEYIKEQEQE